MTPPNVTFCRDIKPGARGNDVTAHKRALSRAYPDLYPWHDFTDYYGEFFERAVIRAKARSNMSSNDGIIRVNFHEKLERTRAKRKPGEWAFDSYAEKIAHDFCTEFTKPKTREEIVEAGFFWYSKRSQINYSQARPFTLLKPPQVPRRWDCSAFVTACHYAGGASDPNNMRYSGYGYTGSLMAGGTRCDLKDLQIGDAILYGFTTKARPGFPKNSPTHVALYVGDGMVLSHGSYPMKYLDYEYRSDINCYVTYDIK